MERIRKSPREIGLDRVFRPGYLRHQWLAAAYEGLVPISRRPQRQPQPRNRQQVQEEYRWA
jgi:hypothetical protein